MPFPVFNILKIRKEKVPYFDGAVLWASSTPPVTSGKTTYHHFDVELKDLDNDYTFIVCARNACNFGNYSAGWGAYRRASDGHVILAYAIDFTTGTFYDTGLVVNDKRISGYARERSGNYNSGGLAGNELQITIDGVGTSVNRGNLYMSNWQGHYSDMGFMCYDSSFTSGSFSVRSVPPRFRGKVYEYEINSNTLKTGTVWLKYDLRAGAGTSLLTVPESVYTFSLVPFTGTIQWVNG